MFYTPSSILLTCLTYLWCSWYPLPLLHLLLTTYVLGSITTSDFKTLVLWVFLFLHWLAKLLGIFWSLSNLRLRETESPLSCWIFKIFYIDPSLATAHTLLRYCIICENYHSPTVSTILPWKAFFLGPITFTSRVLMLEGGSDNTVCSIVMVFDIPSPVSCTYMVLEGKELLRKLLCSLCYKLSF